MKSLIIRIFLKNIYKCNFNDCTRPVIFKNRAHRLRIDAIATTQEIKPT